MTGWSVRHISAQDGRVALVTDAAGPLGRATARRLVRAGAEVVHADSDPERARAAARAAGGAVPGILVRAACLDPADPESLTAFADHLTVELPSLDLLVIHADTSSGQGALLPYALTGRLLPLLLAARGPRVVTVGGPAPREHSRPRGTPRLAHLAPLVFARELQRRADAAGVRLTSVAVRPGTGAGRPPGSGSRLARVLADHGIPRTSHPPAASAALPSLYAATVPGVAPGGLYGPAGRLEGRGSPGPLTPPRAATDPARARELWESCERVTGVSYDWPA
ncbi:SDR family NAD(P)-dependent oxidoreductase [Streptomyces sp. RFCAC02]|uniref:SDR family NAD(P)-dependent oxidoreductase n=1 Tax=Streptomyces sp. RFCAC02 TaxID=2499143 RepID=UPI00102014C8|nr:SDR family NAD(P)-dependent oxidoreductase [Streptomyces sp. RFCAC02]